MVISAAEVAPLRASLPVSEEELTWAILFEACRETLVLQNHSSAPAVCPANSNNGKSAEDGMIVAGAISSKESVTDGNKVRQGRKYFPTSTIKGRMQIKPHFRKKKLYCKVQTIILSVNEITFRWRFVGCMYCPRVKQSTPASRNTAKINVLVSGKSTTRDCQQVANTPCARLNRSTLQGVRSALPELSLQPPQAAAMHLVLRSKLLHDLSSSELERIPLHCSHLSHCRDNMLFFVLLLFTASLGQSPPLRENGHMHLALLHWFKAFMLKLPVLFWRAINLPTPLASFTHRRVDVSFNACKNLQDGYLLESRCNKWVQVVCLQKVTQAPSSQLACRAMLAVVIRCEGSDFEWIPLCISWLCELLAPKSNKKMMFCLQHFALTVTSKPD